MEEIKIKGSPELQVFNSDKFGEIRTKIDSASNQPLFIAKDVCNALGIKKYRDAIARLEDDERGVSVLMDTPGGPQTIATVNEYGLYSLVLKSRKKEAKEFQRWVTHEVLPSIRKDGGYIAASVEESPEEIMAKALRIANATLERKERELADATQKANMLQDQTEAQQKEIEVMHPKAEYTEKVLQSKTTYTFTQVAIDLGLNSTKIFTEMLKACGMIYKQSDQWLTTAKFRKYGIFSTRTVQFVRSNGEVGTSIYSVITEQGRKYLHEWLPKMKEIYTQKKATLKNIY